MPVDDETIRAAAWAIMLDEGCGFTNPSSERVFCDDESLPSVLRRGCCKCQDTARIVAPIIEAALRGQQWRGIESAPRDGTEILAYSEHGCTGTMLVRHIALADFLTDPEGDEYFRQGGSEEAYYDADWHVADFIQGSRLPPDCYPTRWMPLPTPPETDNAD